MNTTELGSDLKAAAANWETPTFDAAELEDLASARRSQRLRRVLASSLAILLLGGAGAAAVWIHADDRTGPQAGQSSGAHTRPTLRVGTAPAAPPPVSFTALGATRQRIGTQRVLARTPRDTSVTVRVRLHFLRHERARVGDTAIVIAQPGTEPAAAPQGTGDYYRASRVAISARVSATAPEQRILIVTTPRDLEPGIYPVLTVVKGALLPGQKSGRLGPYEETSELGVIVIVQR